MEITLRTQNGTDHVISVKIRRLPDSDGICQHCGKTRITRLATLQFPLEVFNLLREKSGAAEQIEAVALLSGQTVYQIRVGLVCLGKFFAQFDHAVDAFLLQTITKAAGRIERYATQLEKLEKYDGNRVADDIWSVSLPTFEQLKAEEDPDKRINIINSIYWQWHEHEKSHPWMKHAPKSATRAIRYHLWYVAKQITSRDTDLHPFKTQFCAWMVQQVAKRLDALKRKLRVAESVHLIGTVR